MAKKSKLRIIPLGGLDEIGKNITAIEYGNDIQSMHCCFTLDELARQFSVTTSLIKYKLQALSLRGYSIDTQDLESFSKLFRAR